MINRFNRGFFTHDRFMDVFIEVLRVQYRGPKYTKLKIRWWNKSQSNNPFIIDYSSYTIKILHTDLKQWKVVQNG